MPSSAEDSPCCKRTTAVCGLARRKRTSRVGSDVAAGSRGSGRGTSIDGSGDGAKIVVVFVVVRRRKRVRVLVALCCSTGSTVSKQKK